MLQLKPAYLALAAFSIIMLASCGESNDEDSTETGTETIAADMPELIPYQLVREYPHDATAFTEGLEYVDGYLYESTGHYGKSDIRKTELETGKIVAKQPMNNKYFGEGMTVLGDKVYQLTYQERTGFIYDKNSLKQLNTFSYNSAEGWGMTNDSAHLIYGDGKTSLIFLDPATLKEVKRLTVTDNYGPVANVNELEYINGYIYANQWNTNLILKINPADGKVVARADLSDIRAKTGVPEPVAYNENAPEVLNGIAYDKANNRIFITGKNWPKLLEIKLDN